MPRTITLALLAATLSGAVAWAAPAAHAAAQAVTSNRIEPGQILAGDLKGTDVYGTDGSRLGRVADLILDRDTGRVAAVVLAVNGKYVGVGMKDLDIPADRGGKPQRITLDMTSSQLRAEKNFELNKTTAAHRTANRPGPTTTPPAYENK